MALVRPFSPFLAAALLFAPLPAQTLAIQPSGAKEATETRTLPLASGSVLKVENVNGFVHVEAWDREEVQFTGEFKPSSREEHVKVVIERGERSMAIRGEHPKRSGWDSYRGPQCLMTLKVPRQVAPSLETVNGEVTLAGVRGAARIETVNGRIEARDLGESLHAETVNGGIRIDQVRGKLALETVNGSIEGQVPEGHDQGIQAETVNGSIHLRMAGVKGRFRASTVNGRISFNAKGAEQVEVKKRHATAVFPGGDQAIGIETVNGSITLD